MAVRVAISSAGLSALVLIPATIGGVAVGGIVHERLPWQLSDEINLALSALAVLIGLFVGGAMWGSAISRIAKVGPGRRMAVAGGVGFGLSATVVVLTLGFLENIVVEQSRGPDISLHNVFTLLFTSAAAIIAGVSGAALAVGSGDRALVGKLAWTCALAGGGAFLVVNLAMDALGWRVGAPGAAERATMLTTAMVGNLAAALTGGAVIGRVFWVRALAPDRMAPRN